MRSDGDTKNSLVGLERLTGRRGFWVKLYQTKPHKGVKLRGLPADLFKLRNKKLNVLLRRSCLNFLL